MSKKKKVIGAGAKAAKKKKTPHRVPKALQAASRAASEASPLAVMLDRFLNEHPDLPQTAVLLAEIAHGLTGHSHGSGYLDDAHEGEIRMRLFHRGIIGSDDYDGVDESEKGEFSKFDYQDTLKSIFADDVEQKLDECGLDSAKLAAFGPFYDKFVEATGSQASRKEVSEAVKTSCIIRFQMRRYVTEYSG